MYGPLNNPFSDSRRLSVLLTTVAILLGLIGLCGWIFDSFFLRSFLSDGATMKVNTALIIISCGISLLLINQDQKKSAYFFLSLTAIFCLAILSEHFFKIDLHIDEWLFHDKDTNPLLEAPGRTSVIAIIDVLFLLTGMLLVLLKQYKASQYLTCLLFLLVYSSLLGHIFGVTGFYRQGHYSGVAFHTSLGLLLLCVALLAYQFRQGWLLLFYSYLKGKNVLVYTFSYLLCAAPLLVAFYLFFINHGEFSPASGVIVLIVISAFISIPVAYLVQQKIGRMDADLRIANEQLEIAMEASNMGMWDLDIQTGIVQRSAKHAEIFGQLYTPFTTTEELMAQFHPDDLEKAKTAFSVAAQQNGRLDIKIRILLSGQHQRWVQILGKTSVDAAGKPLRMLGTMLDITDAKEIEVKKEAFIGVVSHELKTPLTSFKSYVQLVLRKARKEEDEFTINMLSRAEVQADKMTSMIHSFLDVTRLESGKLTLNLETFDMGDLLLETMEEARLLAKGHDIQLEIVADERITADRNKIGEVVSNFISNAVKYSHLGSKVVIRSEKKDNEILIKVIDEGFGIGVKDQAKLFDLFYRVEQKDGGMISGFGIGLYLSAEIIRLHQGKIGVQSQEGAGSVFYFTIPLEGL